MAWPVSWPSRKFPRGNAEHIRYHPIGGLLGVTLPCVFAGMMVLTGLSSPLLQAGGFARATYLCAVANVLAVLIARFRLADKPAGEAALCVEPTKGLTIHFKPEYKERDNVHRSLRR